MWRHSIRLHSGMAIASSKISCNDSSSTSPHALHHTQVPLKKSPGCHTHKLPDQHEVQDHCTAEVNKVQLLISRAVGLHSFIRDFFSTWFQYIMPHQFVFSSPSTFPLPSFLLLASASPGVCFCHGPLTLPSHKPPCSSVISWTAGTQVLNSFCNPSSCCSDI